MNSLACQPPLTDSLVKHFGHFKDVAKSQINQLYRLIARYTARLIDTAEMNRVIRPLCLKLRKAVRAWRHWALSSYYWGNLWRAIVSQDPEHYKIHPEDLALLRKHLRRDDLERVRSLYFQMPVQRLPQPVVDDIYVKLDKWAWACYRRYLRFVSRYDTALSAEDLVATLMVAGIRTMRRYEHEGNPLMALNYAKRAIRNEACNQINRYTRGKRARLINTGDDTKRHFLCRTVSYEHLSSVLQDQPQPNPLLDQIRSHLGPAYADYARAILGGWPAFDEWVKRSTRRSAERMPMQQLQECARTFAGVSQSDLEENLAPLLAEQLQQQPVYFASSMPT